MYQRKSKETSRGFTLVELLVIVMILMILTSIALPAYYSSVTSSRIESANSNARALATAVQARALATGTFDTNLAHYAVDLGGELPLNPCTGTNTGT